MKYEVGKEYRTRGGLVAEILDVNFKSSLGNILGKIRDETGFEIVGHWLGNGRSVVNSTHENDLMPPVETKELWVNVYPSSGIGDYESKSSADEYAVHSRIGILKITIAGDDFTVEKVAI